MNRDNPVVSIGMPVYNGSAFIEEAIESLLGQSFEAFELIISDNASEDETDAICQRYEKQDARIRYFCQNENLGSLNNFRFVLREAKCEYFMWAACDDVWSSDWLEQLVNEMQDDDAGVTGETGFLDQSETGEFVRSDSSLLPSFRQGDYLDFFMNWTSKAMYTYALFRKTALEQAMDSVMATDCLGKDHILLLEVLKHGALRGISGPVVWYRRHADQESIRLRKTYGLSGKIKYYYQFVRHVPDIPTRLSLSLRIPLHIILSSEKLAALRATIKKMAGIS